MKEPGRLSTYITRATAEPASVTGDGKLVGYFATYNERYEVNSAAEGRFLESIDPAAFDLDYIRANAKVLFEHGTDTQIGNKVLGTITDLRSDAKGPAYTVDLFDTSYNADLRPGLMAGAYGSSFRFQVNEDTWDYTHKRSAENPDGLPTRHITRAHVPELGPVTFPANVSATAGIRSTTDTYRIQETPKVDQEYTTREEKAARATELRQSLERLATEYPGVLPATAQTQWDDTTRELDRQQADIAAWDTRQAKLAEFATRSVSGANHVENGDAPTLIFRKSETDIYDPTQYQGGHVRSLEDRQQKLRDNAMRSVETSRFEHPAAEKRDAEIRSHIGLLLDTKDTEDGEIAQRMLKTGSPVYKRAFQKLVKGQPLTMEEERAAALQVVGTTTTGGHAIPYTFDPTFIPTGAYTNINPYRGICRVEQIAGSNNWQGVSVGNIAATYRAESVVVVEGGPTFARPSLTAQRCDAFVTLSRETLQDRPDIGSELAVLINEGKETNEEAQFSVGVGTTVFPQGVALAAAFTVKTTITNDVFAVADLDATEAALPIRHRRDAVWMFSRAVIRIIQGFETVNGKLFNSTLGYPAVGDIKNNPGGNTNMNLLGYPVYETPSIPVTVTVDASIVGVLLNPSQYMILDRVGMDVEIIPNMFDQASGLPNGTRGLLAMWRNTARVLNADGARQIKLQ